MHTQTQQQIAYDRKIHAQSKQNENFLYAVFFLFLLLLFRRFILMDRKINLTYVFEIDFYITRLQF